MARKGAGKFVDVGWAELGVLLRRTSAKFTWSRRGAAGQSTSANLALTIM